MDRVIGRVKYVTVVSFSAGIAYNIYGCCTTVECM